MWAGAERDSSSCPALHPNVGASAGSGVVSSSRFGFGSAFGSHVVQKQHLFLFVNRMRCRRRSSFRIWSTFLFKFKFRFKYKLVPGSGPCLEEGLGRGGEVHVHTHIRIHVHHSNHVHALFTTRLRLRITAGSQSESDLGSNSERRSGSG